MHSDVAAQFKNGNFVVKITRRSFSSIVIDQAHEQNCCERNYGLYTYIHNDPVPVIGPHLQLKKHRFWLWNWVTWPPALKYYLGRRLDFGENGHERFISNMAAIEISSVANGVLSKGLNYNYIYEPLHVTKSQTSTVTFEVWVKFVGCLLFSDN